MLLFIGSGYKPRRAQEAFKYISCYCLSPQSAETPPREANSNTSHVIVYLTSSSLSAPSTIIQIHLMLLFIGENISIIMEMCLNSNTSHVIVYRRQNIIATNLYPHSNTSHVIVYPHLFQSLK